MPHVVRTEETLADLRHIASYIAQDNPAAASAWLDDMEQLFSVLATQPRIGKRMRTKRLGTVRQFSRGNYVVYFKWLADGVEILRVLYGARDHKRLV
jgi:plasmid stabilization system protein ParE